MKSKASLLLVVVVTLLVAATLFVTQAVRKRSAQRSPTAPREDDQSLPGGLVSMEAAAELQIVAHRIRAAWRRDGEPPTSTDGLPPDEDTDPANRPSPASLDPPLDLWGRRYILRRSETEDSNVLLSVVSLGSDGLPGGAGIAQDLSMDIAAPREDE